MPGEFLDPAPLTSIQAFEQVLARVQRLPELDPKRAFASATPGAIGQLTQQMGPWEGREEKRFEIPGVTEGGRAIGADERMIGGSDDIGHIVALPGFEIAGHTQTVKAKAFNYGMTQERARDLAAKPQLDFNDELAHIMLDVMTSGDYSGSVSNAFAWSATDLSGNTQSQKLVTDDADQVENVYPYDGQTFTHWPLRNGTQASAGHDHIFDTGAAWSAADAKTQADNITEHPTAGMVDFYVGSTVATAVSAAKKSDLSNTELVRPLVEGEFTAGKGSDFGFAKAIGVYDSIMYWHMVDLPADVGIGVAHGHQPFHLHIGESGPGGVDNDTGPWSERGDPERRGTSYGYRRTVAAGVLEPLSVTTGEFAA